jgi:UV DNA damage repair endonuclease
VFNTGELTLEEAFSAAVETWHNGIIPLQHISNTDPSLVEGSFSDRRKHSDMIHYVPEVQLNCLKRREIDVDVEAKHKNFAVFNVAEKFDIPI